ncbi:MAG TPA: flagellar biosynthesis protein FlhF [Fibrobacteraceae bacterium]|nr:flagellar biosynthesis protein FlhF [Fibrobacteraceae bacterium]
MKIKKYLANTTREALLQVKAELGPDAVILKIHEPKNLLGKSEGVEVTAALDESEAQPALSTPSAETKSREPRTVQWRNLDQEAAALQGGHNVVGLGGKVEKTMHEVQALRQDVHQLRDEIKTNLQTLQAGIPVEFQSLAKGLEKAGLMPSLVQDLLAEIMLTCPPEERQDQRLLTAARQVIASRIPINPGVPVRRGRSAVMLLLGPTGVGKSTTIAKIAGRELLQGHRNVAILTTDCYRMGALEQMQSFSAAAGIELETVFGLEDVQPALERLKHFDLVLVDTAGRSRNNKEHLDELRDFVAEVHPDEVHLVLSLNTRDRDLQEMVELFRPMGVSRLLFTKQDETFELGALLWLPTQTKLPVSFITTGQRIPDDLQDAQRDLLAGWVLGEVVL